MMGTPARLINNKEICMQPKIQIIDGMKIAEVLYGINHVGHDGKQSGAPDRSATLQHVGVTHEDWDGYPYHKVEMAYSDLTKDFVMVPVGSTRGIVANAFGSLSSQIDRATAPAPAVPEPFLIGDVFDFLGGDLMVCDLQDESVSCMDRNGSVVRFDGVHAKALRAYVRRYYKLPRLCDESAVSADTAGEHACTPIYHCPKCGKDHAIALPIPFVWVCDCGCKFGVDYGISKTGRRCWVYADLIDLRTEPEPPDYTSMPGYGECNYCLYADLTVASGTPCSGCKHINHGIGESRWRPATEATT
jgi:hypothetical protein